MRHSADGSSSRIEGNRDIEVRVDDNLDAPRVRVLWHMSDGGNGHHFDTIDDEVASNANEEPAQSVTSAVTNEIRERMTSYGHLGMRQQLRDIAPAPFTMEPSGADERALLALLGPRAAEVLKDYFPGCEDMTFMQSNRMYWNDVRCGVQRCGYTGEDGFEILIFADAAIEFSKQLLADERVKPIGLGARDSLRLEAGLCLYGHDMDASRDPIEADLGWVIQKSRRERADFPGADRILKALVAGPAEKRVGIPPLERAPAREGTEIHVNGALVGIVTSGGFGPSVDRPIAMGYVRADLTAPGTKIDLMVRGKARAAEVCALPFVQPNYKR